MSLGTGSGLMPDATQGAKKPRRNLRSAKAAGAGHERATATYLADYLESDVIEVRRGNGINDRGDINGVKTIRGGRVVIECKNYTSDRIQITKWLDEAETERGNDDAQIGAVVIKRPGTSNPAQSVVFMTLETFAALLLGGPDDAPVIVPDPMTKEKR